MKKFFSLFALLLCMNVARAQFTTIKIVNNSALPGLLTMLYGNYPSRGACVIGNYTSFTGPIGTGSSYSSFNLATVPWTSPAPPAPVATAFHSLLIGAPVAGGTYDGIPRIDVCHGIPPTIVATSFLSATVLTLTFSSPVAGTLQIDIN